MTIDRELLARVDETVRELDTTRSAFIREALDRALAYHRIRRREAQDAAGYARLPSPAGEGAAWAAE